MMLIAFVRFSTAVNMLFKAFNSFPNAFRTCLRAVHFLDLGLLHLQWGWQILVTSRMCILNSQISISRLAMCLFVGRCGVIMRLGT